MVSYFLYNTQFFKNYSEDAVKAKIRKSFLHVTSGKQNLHSVLEHTYLLTSSFSFFGRKLISSIPAVLLSKIYESSLLFKWF